LLAAVWRKAKTDFERSAIRNSLRSAAGKPDATPEWWTFATDYAVSIGDTLCEGADLLTQALISKGKSITARRHKKIVEVVIAFAGVWRDWNYAKTFVAIAMGIRGRVHEIPMGSQQRFLSEMDLFELTWYLEANDRIRLRSLLSTLPAQRSLPLDGAKLHIVRLKSVHSEFTHRQICAKLDAYNDRTKDAAPVPKEWQRAGHRSWISALDDFKFKSRVKTYISSVKPLSNPFRARAAQGS
jgi:hypothetical protein